MGPVRTMRGIIPQLVILICLVSLCLLSVNAVSSYISFAHTSRDDTIIPFRALVVCGGPCGSPSIEMSISGLNPSAAVKSFVGSITAPNGNVIDNVPETLPFKTTYGASNVVLAYDLINIGNDHTTFYMYGQLTVDNRLPVSTAASVDFRVNNIPKPFSTTDMLARNGTDGADKTTSHIEYYHVNNNTSGLHFYINNLFDDIYEISIDPFLGYRYYSKPEGDECVAVVKKLGTQEVIKRHPFYLTAYGDHMFIAKPILHVDTGREPVLLPRGTDVELICYGFMVKEILTSPTIHNIKYTQLILSSPHTAEDNDAINTVSYILPITKIVDKQYYFDFIPSIGYGVFIAPNESVDGFVSAQFGAQYVPASQNSLLDDTMSFSLYDFPTELYSSIKVGSLIVSCNANPMKTFFPYDKSVILASYTNIELDKPVYMIQHEQRLKECEGNYLLITLALSLVAQPHETIDHLIHTPSIILTATDYLDGGAEYSSYAQTARVWTHSSTSLSPSLYSTIGQHEHTDDKVSDDNTSPMTVLNSSSSSSSVPHHHYEKSELGFSLTKQKYDTIISLRIATDTLEALPLIYIFQDRFHFTLDTSSCETEYEFQDYYIIYTLNCPTMVQYNHHVSKDEKIEFSAPFMIISPSHSYALYGVIDIPHLGDTYDSGYKPLASLIWAVVIIGVMTIALIGAIIYFKRRNTPQHSMSDSSVIVEGDTGYSPVV